MTKIFPIIYCFLIVSFFLIGQLSFMGTSLNYNTVSTIVTFACCCTFEKPKIDRWMSLYLVFIAFYTLSALVTGGFDVLFHKLYSTLLISYTGYWATTIMVRHYGTLKPLVYTILLVGIIDATVTAFQALGIPLHNPLLDSIIEDTDQEDYLAIHDNIMGFAISGLYYNPVFNGHNLLFFLLVSLLTQYEKLDMKTIIFPLIIWGGLFFCQQRGAFFAGSVSLIYIIYQRMLNNSKYKFVTVIFLSVLLVVGLNFIWKFVTASGSRLIETSSTGRDETWSLAIDFISSNILLGGYYLFAKTTHEYSHNLILSAYIAGGIIGGTVLMKLVCQQLCFAYKKIRENGYVLFIIISIMYAALIFDSMLHNTGLVEMDFSTFVAWALMSSVMKENNNLKIV